MFLISVIRRSPAECFPRSHQVDAGSPSFTGNDVCPIGYFCRNGTSYPVACPTGTFSLNPALGAVDECEPCPPGRWCNTTAYIADTPAPLCNPGSVPPPLSQPPLCTPLAGLEPGQISSILSDTGIVAFDTRRSKLVPLD